MRPYTPEQLPPQKLDWESIIPLLGRANRGIALYDGQLRSIVNPDVLLSPLRTQEAVLSSKIEGTQATLEEVMEFDAGGKTHEKRGDIQEVVNYRKALLAGRDHMEELPLSLRVIRNMHEVLLAGVRGEAKDPGQFRKIQNWIGGPGSTLETARFVPPTVPDMTEGLYNWEKYLHTDDKDILVQLAVVHAQFEILHPFIDGNGRIGRLLIPLFLFHKQIIHQPVFYMSHYLEGHRQTYYDALKSVTDKGDWTQWVVFFLNGLIRQAEKNTAQTREILELYDSMKLTIVEKTHSQWAIQCLDFIFSQPIFTSSDFHEMSGVPRTSAARLLRSMEESGIVECTVRGRGRRPGLYNFRRLINIVSL